MSPWDGLNRRRFPRVACPCRVVIRAADGEERAFLTHTENIGVGGVGVLLRAGLKVFTPVELEVDLLDLEENLRCRGRVVWSVRRKESDPEKPLFHDIGIEFHDIGDRDRRRLEALIERARQKAFPVL